MENETITEKMSLRDRIESNVANSRQPQNVRQDKEEEDIDDVETEDVDETSDTDDSDATEDEETQDVDTTDEEKFSEIDPKSLSPEDLTKYKSMQADYTRKRQIDAQKVKEAEAKLAEVLKKYEAVAEQPQTPKQDNSELLKALPPEVREAVKELVNQENQRIKDESEADRIQRQEEEFKEWEESAILDLEVLDNRLDEEAPEYDEIFDVVVRNKLNKKLDAYLKENASPKGFNTKKEALAIIDEFNKYKDSSNKSFLKKQSAIAQNKTDLSRLTTPNTTSPRTTAVEETPRGIRAIAERNLKKSMNKK